VRSLATALALVSAAAIAGCAKPPPDLDGEPGGAVALPLGETHGDTLACKKQNDCADWYRIAVPGPGKLSLDVDPAAANGAAGFRARVVDQSGAALTEGDSAGGRAPIRLHSDVSGGTLLVEIAPASPEAEVGYAITARFKPAPPPPKIAEPRFATQSAAVLEVEGERTAHVAVLLDAGEGAKLAPGMRGRLVDRGKTIGAIVIQDVYPDGSRARVDGALSDKIGPHTTAEIDVPLAAPAGSETAPGN
jgi:hypothetical protein